MTRPNSDALSPYNRMELAIVFDPADERRCVPAYDCTGWSVLDVGCGSGQTLLAPELAKAAERHGIDIDASAIEAGRRSFPELVLSVSPAEAIGYPDATFDLTLSRVAVVYTNIPTALQQIRRVTKPGGRIWLVLHPWAMTRDAIVANIRQRNWRRLASLAYVTGNGLSLHFTGRCFARPDIGSYESFQTVGGMRRALEALGFEEIAFDTRRHFIVTARRSGMPPG